MTCLRWVEKAYKSRWNIKVILLQGKKYRIFAVNSNLHFLLLSQKLLDAYEEQNVDMYTDSVSKIFDHIL